MLRVVVKGDEFFDQETEKFINTDDYVLDLEHSLVAISKWEAKYEITFLSKREKTAEQTRYYIKCMSLSGNIPDEVLDRLSMDNVKQIREYITSKQSATRFTQMPNHAPSREKVTSELIYYWMIAMQIPWEAQHWHIERLLTLIDLCQRKNNTGNRKMNKSDMIRHRNAINAQRRQQYGTSG